MGTLRLLVDVALRDVVLLLHKRGCAQALIADVSARLLKLLTEVVRVEERTIHQLAAPASGVALCRGIVEDLIGIAVCSVAPARENARLQAEAVRFREKLEEERRVATTLQAELELAQGAKARHLAAHELSLRAFFREVLLLRRRNLAEVVVEQGLSAEGGRPAVPPRQGLMRSSQAQVDEGGKSETVLPQMSRRTKQMQPHELDACAARDEHFLQLVNGDAIFDYSRYVELHHGVSVNAQEELRSLREEFAEFRERTRIAKENSDAHLAAVVQNKRAESRELLARIAELTVALKRARGVAREGLSGLRATLEPLRSVITRAQLSIEAMGGLAQSSAEAMHVHAELLVNYVTAACHFMSSQSRGAASDAFTRAEFQKALASDAADDDATKEAKQWWRRHHVTGVVLSTVVAVRRAQADHQDVSRRLELLSALPHQSTTTTSTISASAAPAGGSRASVVSSSSSAVATTTGPRPGRSIGARGATSARTFAATTGAPREPLLFSEAAQLSNDFELLHKLFTVARDETSSLALGDRAAILDAAVRHRGLSHQRSSEIFSRICRKRRAQRRRKELASLIGDDDSGSSGGGGGGSGGSGSFPHLGHEALVRIATARRLRQGLPSSTPGPNSGDNNVAGRSTSLPDTADAAHQWRLRLREALQQAVERDADQEITSGERCASLRAQMVENATRLLVALDRSLVLGVKGSGWGVRAGANENLSNALRAGQPAPPLFSTPARSRRGPLAAPPPSSQQEMGPEWEAACGLQATTEQQHQPCGVLLPRNNLGGDPRDEILMVIKGAATVRGPRRAFIVPTTGGIGPSQLTESSALVIAQSERAREQLRILEDELAASGAEGHAVTSQRQGDMQKQRQLRRRHDSAHGRHRAAAAALRHAPRPPTAPQRPSAAMAPNAQQRQVLQIRGSREDATATADRKRGSRRRAVASAPAGLRAAAAEESGSSDEAGPG